ARQHDAAVRALDQIGNIAVAGIVVALRIRDADDRPVERIVGIAHRLDEGLAQKQREAGVAVAGQSLTQPFGHSIVPGIPRRRGARRRNSFTPFVLRTPISDLQAAQLICYTQVTTVADWI